MDAQLAPVGGSVRGRELGCSQKPTRVHVLPVWAIVHTLACCLASCGDSDLSLGEASRSWKPSHPFPVHASARISSRPVLTAPKGKWECMGSGMQTHPFSGVPTVSTSPRITPAARAFSALFWLGQCPRHFSHSPPSPRSTPTLPETFGAPRMSARIQGQGCESGLVLPLRRGAGLGEEVGSEPQPG